MTTPVVFLDRDGTLVEEVGYLDRIERLELYPWTVEAVRLLNRHGCRVIVVTNQSGVARGFFDEPFVIRLHQEIDRRLTAGGARIDGFYYCPHHPDAPIVQYRLRCDCRKPQVGLVRRAQRDLSLDLSRAYVVGDRWLDMKLADAIGAEGILVRTGYGSKEEANPQDGAEASAIVSNLMEAASWVLRRSP